MTHLLPNFPPGPLDFYRNKASFDWKKLKVFIDSEDAIQYQNELHEAIEKHPEFKTDLLSPSFDEVRRQGFRRVLAAQDLDIDIATHAQKNIKRIHQIFRTMGPFTPSNVGRGLFISSVRSQGTRRHDTILKQALKGEIWGCFCLTEIGHGSNTKGMRTTATYDKVNQQFVLHSPDFEAAKCWAGNLGQVATHAAVYAQLYVDGVHHGLHTFVVPIRDPKTMLPLPGIVVGDLGEKIGLNPIDNGFLIFEHYRIPRENLLNRSADVTPEGKYVAPIKDPRKRHGAALGVLSQGRVNITEMSEFNGTRALTIAIRYAAVRKQFGPEGEGEVPILEYQSHQLRLLPYLAGAYVVRFFSMYLSEVNLKFIADTQMVGSTESMPELGMEIHVVSSASKPVSAWLFRDAIQECREACGGHGYLKVARIGDIRSDHEPNVTWEGENHVLIQQTSNWLLKLWPLIEAGKKIKTPLKSADFLSDALRILQTRFSAHTTEEVCNPKNIISAYQWLVCYLLKETKAKYDALAKQGGDFWAKNNTQVFYAKNLAIAFIQHFFLQHMLVVIGESTDSNIRKVLVKLFSLYGLWSLEKFLGSLYEGGYAQGAQASRLIHEAILTLCNDIKNDAVALIDAIAPPDFILNSVLGMSDGQVYQHLKSAFFRSPYAMSRPSWWKELVHWKANLKNKL